jgi:hypothetical protein
MAIEMPSDKMELIEFDPDLKRYMPVRALQVEETDVPLIQIRTDFYPGTLNDDETNP